MTAPAWWRRLRAAVSGYFWMPCPVCGRYFAGYEEPHGSLRRDERGGSMFCARCVTKYGRTIALPATVYDIRKIYDVPLEVLGHDFGGTFLSKGAP